jgi:prepilin-type N-terminal cleavage/methylation domain-containing protein
LPKEKNMAIQLHNKNSRGVTLIELLVVVAIISVLTAMMIPRLRTINKDRNIREAARIVGSVFANASQRAIAEGGSGVLLERNPNFTSPTGIPGVIPLVKFACTTLYTLRNLPPYIGDEEDSLADIAVGVVSIDKPLEHDEVATPPRLVVRENDFISLNNSSVRYRINAVAVNGSKLDIELDDAGFLPDPPTTTTTGVPFVIYRQPRKLESSRVELPDGYMVDFRYSGPTLSGAFVANGCHCNQPINPLFADQDAANEIRIIMDGKGTMDWMYAYDNLVAPDPGAIDAMRPNQPLFLFVSAFELDETVMPIDRPSNLWVTASHTNGGVNVGYSVPPTGLFDMDGDEIVGTAADRILEARDMASNQQSANQ